MLGASIQRVNFVLRLDQRDQPQRAAPHVLPALRDARGPRLALVVVEGEHPRDQVFVENDAAF